MKRVLSTTDNPTSNGEDKHGGGEGEGGRAGELQPVSSLGVSLSLSPFLSQRYLPLSALPASPSLPLTHSLPLSTHP